MPPDEVVETDNQLSNQLYHKVPTKAITSKDYTENNQAHAPFDQK
jgi:hypothetical protein